MDFLLYQVAARLVAIYFAYDSGRQLWSGYGERKIADMNDDITSLFIDRSKVIFYRDTMPVRYWTTVGLQITIFICSLVVLIFGLWHPQN